MKMNVTKSCLVIAIAVIALILSGCKFEEITQPTTAIAGEQITVNLSISTSDSDANTKWGLLGLLIPNDWTVDTVYYGGDFGTGGAHFLHPDSSDKYPSKYDTGWADSIDAIRPSGDNMRWEVWEANDGHSWSVKSYIDATVLMTVGNTNGTYGLGYFFTEGAMDLRFILYGIPYTDSLGNMITVTGAAVKDEKLIVNKFNLSQNFPNPFNPATKIGYQIAENAIVNLTVFDVFGREVATLVNEAKAAGNYHVTFSGKNLPSGIYFYKLQAGSQAFTRKMVLAK